MFNLDVKLYKIKECKYKYPHKIDKVPVETNFLNHFVMTSSVVDAFNYTNKNYDINQNT